MIKISEKTIGILFVSALTILLSCMQNDKSLLSDSQKYREKLTRFLLYSPIAMQPEMHVSPYDGEYSVSPDTNIEIIFNREVRKTSDWRVIVDLITYDSSSPEIFWDRIYMADNSYNVLVIHPRKPFMRGATISLTAEGFITDNGIARFPRCDSSFSVYYPALSVSVTPPNYASPISPDTDVVLSFSEAVDEDGDWNVTIDGNVYDKSSPEILWNEQHTILTINPSGYFQRSRTIYVYRSGFTAYFDGCPFPNSTTRFTIMSGVTATVSPRNGEKAVYVDRDIVITFSENMVMNDGWSITADGVTYNKDYSGITWNDAQTLTIVKDHDFPYLSTITMTLQGFHAELDNSYFTGPGSVTFRTALNIENIPMNDTISSGTRFSAAIDSSDAIYLGYYDVKNYCPVYMTNKDGTWQNYTIDTEEYYGRNLAIAIDSSNSIMAAYEDTWDRNITYATDQGGSWTYEKFDPDKWINGISIASDSYNVAHISYWYEITTRDLLYANNSGGTWTIETIDADLDSGGNTSSIAVDLNDKIHISYWSDYHLCYATNKGGTWMKYIVDPNNSTGFNSVIAIDSNGYVHITYYNNSSWPSGLYYTTNKSGSWQRTRIDSVYHSSNGISLCIDSHNAVYICYTDYVTGDYIDFTKLATTKTGFWTIHYVDSDDWLGDHASMVIDSNDIVHMFYQCGYSSGVLRHAIYIPY
ncbi:MAG: Ig-like domain-containing protein [Spirochaetes bacterium]|nr:Ig-like domain-containing protein [Spirochaetota bacterium]